MAEEMAQSMISLGGEDDAAADEAAPVSKGVGGNVAAGSKLSDRAPAAEQEMEMKEDDLEGDTSSMTCNKKLPMTLFSHTLMF